MEIQSVAVGWQVYEITKRPLDLGYVGLAQFLPGFVLFLFAGHAADHVSIAARLLTCCYAGCRSLLRPSARHLVVGHRNRFCAVYLVLVLVGVARSFQFSREPCHPAAVSS